MKNSKSLILLIGSVAIVLATWTSLAITQKLVVKENQNDHPEQQKLVDAPIMNNSNRTVISRSNNNTLATVSAISAAGTGSSSPIKTSSKSKILGFADSAYIKYAIRWYHRLSDLGYTEHVIVTVDENATSFFRNHRQGGNTIRYEELPYKPCIKVEQDSRKYRRQLFGRRWKYVYDQLRQGYSILITDVDNVFRRYVPLSEYGNSVYDTYHAYSTSYPQDVFQELGFTVCGGMSWLRSHSTVIRFVGTLVNKCKCLKATTRHELCNEGCYCDDQVILNEMLLKGKHQVVWDTTFPTNGTKRSLSDYPWKSITGTSQTTGHKIKIWDRSFAYRAPLPGKCPSNPSENWVAMPLYVDRDVVVDVWDKLCSNSLSLPERNDQLSWIK